MKHVRARTIDIQYIRAHRWLELSVICQCSSCRMFCLCACCRVTSGNNLRHLSRKVINSRRWKMFFFNWFSHYFLTTRDRNTGWRIPKQNNNGKLPIRLLHSSPSVPFIIVSLLSHLGKPLIMKFKWCWTLQVHCCLIPIMLIVVGFIVDAFNLIQLLFGSLSHSHFSVPKV